MTEKERKKFDGKFSNEGITKSHLRDIPVAFVRDYLIRAILTSQQTKEDSHCDKMERTQIDRNCDTVKLFTTKNNIVRGNTVSR